MKPNLNLHDFDQVSTSKYTLLLQRGLNVFTLLYWSLNLTKSKPKTDTYFIFLIAFVNINKD